MHTIRFTGNIFLHTNFAGQWGAHFQAVNLPVFHCVLRGSAWVGTENPDSFVKLEQGDIAFLPGGIEHFIADSPESDRMKMTIVPGHSCMHTDVPDAEADVQLLCGVFQTKDDFQHPLFKTLPDLMHVQFSESEAGVSVHQHVAYMINDAIKVSSAGTDILSALSDWAV